MNTQMDYIDFQRPQWKRWEGDPVPLLVVAGFIFSPYSGDFVMLHRSSKVRSAPNCWSLPSGLWEAGESAEGCFAREMKEELNLEVEPRKLKMLGEYENKPGDGWHWVIRVFFAPCVDLNDLENREPDKHDEVEFVNYSALFDLPQFLSEYPTHPSLAAWMKRRARWVARELEKISNYRKSRIL